MLFCAFGILTRLDSHFLSTDHYVHRRRRKPLDPYFSRAGVSRLEPMIWGLTIKLMKRFEALRGTGEVVRLDHAMLAFSADVIARICCDEPTDLVDHPAFGPHWYAP